MKKSNRPRIDAGLVDLLVENKLMLLGITDAKSYFKTRTGRIVVWVIVCASIGSWQGGLGGAMWGASVGLAMPVLMIYMSIVFPMVMAQTVGYLLGVLWIVFVAWMFLAVMFR